MPKVLVKSKEISVVQKIQKGKKPGYVTLMVSIETPLTSFTYKDSDIHGVVVDKDLITPKEISAIKDLIGDYMFPVVLVADSLSEQEAGMWIGSGASDIISPSLPCAIIGKRLGSLIQLYCMTQSIYGQSTDKLTGLYNRTAFYHFAKEMINAEPQGEYSVIISDIEYFKRINERFGEEQGDALLRHVSSILRKMNNDNVLFARYSGDQFVGIMRKPKTDFAFDPVLFEKSMKQFYDNSPVDHFNVQFGLYENVDKNLPVSIMCDRAMLALNTIKHQYGRNFAKYTLQLQQKFSREQQILDSMESAIREHQFEVYYQPKHDTRTSEITGAEALVRWNHPVYGFMSPAEFIPLFERSGFIVKMDEYVWNQVCLDMNTMIENKLPLVPISINVSRKDLATTHFVEMLERMIKDHNLDSKLFHMELTETVYMEDAEALAPLLKKVKDIGLEIELDDFGSGYSSLGIMSKLPVDIVKLDISLIRNLEKQPAIVDHIVHMMHTLGYETTAEGVDNERQVDILRNIGCDNIQGYYYSKPMTMNGFCKYVADFSESTQ